MNISHWGQSLTTSLPWRLIRFTLIGSSPPCNGLLIRSFFFWICGLGISSIPPFTAGWTTDKKKFFGQWTIKSPHLQKQWQWKKNQHLFIVPEKAKLDVVTGIFLTFHKRNWDPYLLFKKKIRTESVQPHTQIKIYFKCFYCTRLRKWSEIRCQTVVGDFVKQQSSKWSRPPPAWVHWRS